MYIIFAAAHVDDSTGTGIINKLFVDFGGHLKKSPYVNKLCPSPCRSFSILLFSRVYTKTYITL